MLLAQPGQICVNQSTSIPSESFPNRSRVFSSLLPPLYQRSLLSLIRTVILFPNPQSSGILLSNFLTPVVQLTSFASWFSGFHEIAPNAPLSAPGDQVSTLIFLDGQIWGKTSIELCVCSVHGRIQHGVEELGSHFAISSGCMSLQFRFEIAWVI